MRRSRGVAWSRRRDGSLASCGGPPSGNHRRSFRPSRGRRFGDYELFEELGRGGMGVVTRRAGNGAGPGRGVEAAPWRVRICAAGRRAVPGRIPGRGAARASSRRPGLAGRECDGHPYFTMQYVEGTTLAKKLADGPLPALEAARLLVPVCRAIHYAHEHGVLHRDLKPSNILIDRPGPAVRQRLRPGQADRRRSVAHAFRGNRGHAELHGARAGREPATGRRVRGRSGERCLQPGRDPLPDADRPAAVPGRHAGSRRSCWPWSTTRSRRACSTPGSTPTSR